MVQDQLIDYITAQTKAGTSRDAIHAALLGAGWQAIDVEDSFKKIEGAARPVQAPAMAQTPAQPVVLSSMPAMTTRPAQASPVIRMSDLVSATDGPAVSTNAASTLKMAPKMVSSSAKDPFFAGKSAASTSGSAATTFPAVTPHSGSKKGVVMGTVGGLLIVVLGGLAGYLYVQNNTLSEKVASLGGTSTDVASQIESLTSEVNALTASGAALTTSMAGLEAANKELMAELSFYAAPLGAAPTATAISVTGSLGLVSVSKSYFVTASYGGKIYVSNSKDAKVVAALQPLVGSSTQLGGTFVPGSDVMTVTSVNGVAL